MPDEPPTLPYAPVKPEPPEPPDVGPREAIACVVWLLVLSIGFGLHEWLRPRPPGITPGMAKLDPAELDHVPAKPEFMP
jgi:hypothetical protein